MRTQAYPPHLTFGIYPHLDAAAELASKAISAAFGDLPAQRVRFSRIAVFDGASPVLYLPPEEDEPLRRLHRDLAARLKGVAVDPLYAPGAWTPQLTIASAVDPVSARRARAFADSAIVPFHLWLDHAEVVRLPEVEVVSAIQLKGVTR